MGTHDHTAGPAEERSPAPLNQEPGTAAPRGRESAAGYEDERSNEDTGNKGPDEMPGFGQGA
jgi:hypothetical protein